MLNLFEKFSTQVYKFIAFILFFIGVFSVNSTCDLIFHQPEEPISLKRFCKK